MTGKDLYDTKRHDGDYWALPSWEEIPDIEKAMWRNTAMPTQKELGDAIDTLEDAQEGVYLGHYDIEPILVMLRSMRRRRKNEAK